MKEMIMLPQFDKNYIVLRHKNSLKSKMFAIKQEFLAWLSVLTNYQLILFFVSSLLVQN